MTFDDIKEMQIGSKKVKEAWLNGRQVYPSKKRIMDSLVCWYDIGKQQCTNESMAANPVLVDLSGNGHDMTCYNFAWAEESGISTTNYPNALVSDGVDDYANTEGLPILTDYTVIAKRKWIKTDYNTFATFSSKTSTTTNGEFIFERFDQYGNPQTFSFGVSTAIETFAENITYQTPTSYNGKVIGKGNFLGDDRLVLFGLRGAVQHSNIALYSFLLFDRTLTTAEIEWVKKNMIESGGEVLATNWADSSLWAFYNEANQVRITGTLSSNRMTISSSGMTNPNMSATSNFMECIVLNSIVPAYKIKVSGLKNGIILNYKDNLIRVEMSEDGIYNIPEHNAQNRYFGFSFNKAFENENIVIQQLLSE